MWGNEYNGDCVTAEEAFAKACHTPEIFIGPRKVALWAQARGFYQGAYLIDVLTAMHKEGFNAGGNLYNDGAHSAVDWTDAATLKSAISQGPVKIGIAADQLQNVIDAYGIGKNGWFCTGFTKDQNEDHCTSLCGYGTVAWIAEQLGVTTPPNAVGADPAYAMFTWGSIGIIDVPSLIAITGEAWLRNPTTVIIAE